MNPSTSRVCPFTPSWHGQPVSVSAISAREVGEGFEVALAARFQQLERRLQAAILEALDATLREQFRALDDPADDGETLKVRLLPARASAAILTRREQQVAGRIARGLSNRQIAADLVIAISTTERHVANILNKLGMRSRSQVAAWAARQARQQRPLPADCASHLGLAAGLNGARTCGFCRGDNQPPLGRADECGSTGRTHDIDQAVRPR